MISEVKILTLEEEIELTRKEEREIGWEEGWKIGIEIATDEMVKRLLVAKMEGNIIAQVVEIPINRVLEIKKQLLE
jgi:hypothetical protein